MMKYVSALLVCALVFMVAGSAGACHWVKDADETDLGSGSEQEEPESEYSTAEEERLLGTGDDKGLSAEAEATVMAYADPEEEDLEATAEAGWSSPVYRKQQYYWWIKPTDPQDVPYTTFGYDICITIDWYVNGNSNNWGLSTGTSKGDAQGMVNIDSVPDNDADRATSGRWAAEKPEGGVFNSIALVLSWPPALELDWDLTSDIWKDDDYDDDWYRGTVDNVVGGSYVEEVSMEVALKAKATAEALNDAILAHAHVLVDCTSFSFGPPVVH